MNEVMEEYLSELKQRAVQDKEEALKKENEEKEEEVDAAVEDKEEIIENKDEKKEEK